MSTATYAWRGIDDAHRFDIARAELGHEACSARGTSVTLDYELTWSLDVTPGWLTRSLIVEKRAAGSHERLTLERAANGSWDGERTDLRTGRNEPIPNEIVKALDGALDCDLGKCPFTNLMPVRRLVRDGTVGRWVNHTMAWVRVPTLDVVPATQQYRLAEARPDGATVLYRGSTPQTYELVTDADHVVLDYPTLARRVPAEAGNP